MLAPVIFAIASRTSSDHVVTLAVAELSCVLLAISTVGVNTLARAMTVPGWRYVVTFWAPQL
jgi:hypothetical protein